MGGETDPGAEVALDALLGVSNACSGDVFAANNGSKNEPAFRFLDLPAELRNVIYEDVLGGHTIEPL